MDAIHATLLVKHLFKGVKTFNITEEDAIKAIEGVFELPADDFMKKELSIILAMYAASVAEDLEK